MPLACDEVEQLLGMHEGDVALHAQYTELRAAYGAAREVANRYEQGLDVDPGDIGAAIENLRVVRNAILPVGPA